MEKNRAITNNVSSKKSKDKEDFLIRQNSFVI